MTLISSAPPARQRGTDASGTVPAAAVTGWRRTLPLLAVALAGLLLLFDETVAATLRTWSGSASFNHGFAIVPMALYLIWDRRHSIAAVVPRPAAWGLAVVLGGSLLWMLGRLGGLLIAEQAALVVMIHGLVIAVAGGAAWKRLLFPLGILVFAVPFGTELIPWLQDVTATISVNVLRGLGTPVFMDGLYMTTTAGRFHVAEACSGLRFLTTTLAVGYVFAGWFYRSWGRRLAFMGLAVAVPIIANGLRAAGIVLIAHAFGQEAAIGFDHLVYGWIFFSLVTAILLGLGWAFRQCGGTAPEETTPSAGETPRVLPLWMTGGVAALALLVAGSGPAWAEAARAAIAARTAVPVTLALPAHQPVAGALDAQAWQPGHEAADMTLRDRIIGPEVPVDRFVALHGGGPDGELIGHALTLIPDPWSRTGGRRLSPDAEGAPAEVMETVMRTPGARRLMWHWYWIDGETTTDRRLGKLRQLAATLTGTPPRSAVIALSVPAPETLDGDNGLEAARTALRQALRAQGDLGPVLAGPTSP